MPPDPLVLYFAHYLCKYTSENIYYNSNNDGINSLRGNSTIILKFSNFCNVTQHGYMHADNTFKKFSVPVSTGTSNVDKLLKMPSDSISEGVVFQNFLRGHAPRPP